MQIKTVAIVGMGALGMLYGEQLQKVLPAGAVRFVMDEERFKRHKNDKYEVNGVEQSFTLQSVAQAEPVDLVIVATKFSGLNEALEEMQGLVGPQTIIFSVLNGISSE